MYILLFSVNMHFTCHLAFEGHDRREKRWSYVKGKFCCFIGSNLGLTEESSRVSNTESDIHNYSPLCIFLSWHRW